MMDQHAHKEERQQLPSLRIPKNPMVIIAILLITLFLLSSLYTFSRSVINPLPDITPTPTLQTQELRPGWQTFTDENISFQYPVDYAAVMRENLYYAISNRTAAEEAEISIDLRRENPLNDYAKAVDTMKKKLQFMSEQPYKNGVQLSGQIAEETQKNLPYIVTLLPYDAGAISIESTGERINTAVYQGIITSLDISKAPTSLNIPVAITRAKNSLAGTLNVLPTAIKMEKMEPREWNNSGLGCEESGEMTLQVITPGYRVVFSHNSKTYIYHTDERETFKEC